MPRLFDRAADGARSAADRRVATLNNFPLAASKVGNNGIIETVDDRSARNREARLRQNEQDSENGLRFVRA